MKASSSGMPRICGSPITRTRTSGLSRSSTRAGSSSGDYGYMPHFIEVSHAIEAGMKTYPGLPEPRVEVFMDFDESRSRYAGGTEFFIANLHLCGNTGTYVDSPFHRYRTGIDLSL